MTIMETEGLTLAKLREAHRILEESWNEVRCHDCNDVLGKKDYTIGVFLGPFGHRWSAYFCRPCAKKPKWGLITRT